MMRKIAMIIGLLAAAVLMTEVCGLAYLYLKGSLTQTTLVDIQSVLKGEPVLTSEDRQEQETVLPSREDIARERSLMILGLNERENLLIALKNSITKQAENMVAEREDLKRRQKELEDRLNALDKETAAASLEQTRGILKAMRSADAVVSLMAIPHSQAVMILKGMPDDSVARLLQEFLKGTPEQAQRGQQIFTAITEGQPKKEILDQIRNGENQEEDTP